MVYRKVQVNNSWITFVVNGHEVVQIHSNGFITMGHDDEGKNEQLLDILEMLAEEGQLHSQTNNRGGVS